MNLETIIIGGVFFIAAYLIGSVPFGLILTKLAGYGDIRSIGSGNIGATNVLRTGNKKLALATLILDGGKGAFAVEIAKWAVIWVSINTQNSYYEVSLLPFIAGFVAILGHIFPVWLKFKGGKGVATALGTLLVAVPCAGLIACGFWIATAVIFRMSSLAALTAMIAGAIAAYLIYGAAPELITLIIAAIVWARHKDNIRRLLKGEEPKIGKKKNAPAV